VRDFILRAVTNHPALKLEWTGPDFALPGYSVDAVRVKNACKSVRDALKLLQQQLLRTPDEYSAQLLPLRIAGADLNTALFRNPLADGGSAEFIENEIRTVCIGSRRSLLISTDLGVQVPWNFVFDGDPFAQLPFTGTPSDFDGFWLNKFKLAVSYNQQTLNPPIRRGLPKNTVKTLLAIDETEASRTFPALAMEPKISNYWDSLVEREVGVVYNWNDCRRKWDTISQDNSIIYIFGHSNGQEISLKGELSTVPLSERYQYVLGSGNFNGIFLKAKHVRSHTMCFINGCRSGGGSDGDGFLGVATSPGFSGFIGTEAEIDNIRATRYAIIFLTMLLDSGKAVGDIMEELRELLFPESIWYTCYGDANFNIAVS
jgi:hypothetical protein